MEEGRGNYRGQKWYYRGVSVWSEGRYGVQEEVVFLIHLALFYLYSYLCIFILFAIVIYVLNMCFFYVLNFVSAQRKFLRSALMFIS